MTGTETQVEVSTNADQQRSHRAGVGEAVKRIARFAASKMPATDRAVFSPLGNLIKLGIKGLTEAKNIDREAVYEAHQAIDWDAYCTAQKQLQADMRLAHDGPIVTVEGGYASTDAADAFTRLLVPSDGGDVRKATLLEIASKF